MQSHEFEIRPPWEPRRLDALLADRYPQFSREEWQARIRSHRVLVNEAHCKPARKLQTGDRIRFFFEKPPEPEVNRDYRIVHSDDCLLIIDKPANLPVHPSGIYHKNTLHHLLKEKFGDDFKAHFISRLDRETSGLMLMARTSIMARELQKQMRAGQIRKEYRALVDLQIAGTAFPDYMDARGFLYPHPNSVIRKKQAYSADLPDDICESIRVRARPVRTELFGDRRKENIQLIRARLHTGRMHQIRATLCSLGYPMIGDRLYGRDESLYLEMIQNKNPHQEAEIRKRALEILHLEFTALHSSRLEFTHPASNRLIAFESDLPAHFFNLL